MAKHFIYHICRICFFDMVESDSFVQTSPLSLMDQIGDVHYHYHLSEINPCDSLKKDNYIESICTMASNA